MTRQRELIINILKQSDRHLTADEIFFLAKLKMPSIAMATIYNNLNAMNEAGLVKRLHIDGVADCFDKIVEPHDHLLCGFGRKPSRDRPGDRRSQALYDSRRRRAFPDGTL